MTKKGRSLSTRRRADDGSGCSESDLSEEDTATRSDASPVSSEEEDDLTEDEEDLFFSDSASSEEEEDVVVEEEGRDLEAVLEAAQGTRVLPALWLSCLWLRAQPEVLAGTPSSSPSTSTYRYFGTARAPIIRRR